MTNRKALLLAVVLLPAAAQAQYRIDNSQSRDANNRIGSGGFNSGSQLNGRINGLAGNYIVTGNITGGRAFRGSLGYTDPTAFRGSLGSASFDSFLRDSIGTSQMRGTSMAGPNFATLGSPQPFFGQSSVAPPSGFARDPNTGTFFLPKTSSGVTAADGRIDYGGATRSDIQQGVLSSQRVTGGAGLASTPVTQLNQRDQLARLTRMSDFTTIARPEDNASQNANGESDVLGTGPRLPKAPGETPPVEKSTEEADKTDASSASLTGQGTVYKNLRALENNTQYAELRKRLDEKNKLPKLPGSEAAESLRSVNADILAARQKEKDSKAGDKKESSGPTIPGVGDVPAEQPKGEESKDSKTPVPPQDNLNLPRPKEEAVVAPSAPLEINSLAVGVKDKNLAKVLADAESAMKSGRFSTAIDAYDRAEELAPDDPLVFMGRSMAELGGGYYRSAEVHFRQAFAADPALLLAKFDLRAMLSDERLNALQGDLAQIAKKNTKDGGPLLLLAFIYYNTGFPERSERALDMVQERTGGKDETAATLKQAWFAGSAKPAAPAQTPEQSK